MTFFIIWEIVHILQILLVCSFLISGHVYLLCINKAIVNTLLVDVMYLYLLGIARSQGRHMLNSGHNTKQFFQNNGILEIQCHQRCMKVPVVSHPVSSWYCSVFKSQPLQCIFSPKFEPLYCSIFYIKVPHKSSCA